MIEFRFTVALFIVDAIIYQPSPVSLRIDIDTRHDAAAIDDFPGVARILGFREGDLAGRRFLYSGIIKNVTVIEDVSTNMRYSLAVMSAGQTSEVIADRQLLDERAVALMDVPIFQTFEGYILREGFRFAYYWSDWVDDADKLDLGEE